MRIFKFDGSEIGALSDDLSNGALLMMGPSPSWEPPDGAFDFAKWVRDDERAVELDPADAERLLAAIGAPPVPELESKSKKD